MDSPKLMLINIKFLSIIIIQTTISVAHFHISFMELFTFIIIFLLNFSLSFIVRLISFFVHPLSTRKSYPIAILNIFMPHNLAIQQNAAIQIFLVTFIYTILNFFIMFIS
jgi:hypothetical protein